VLSLLHQRNTLSDPPNICMLNRRSAAEVSGCKRFLETERSAESTLTWLQQQMTTIRHSIAAMHAASEADAADLKSEAAHDEAMQEADERAHELAAAIQTLSAVAAQNSSGLEEQIAQGKSSLLQLQRAAQEQANTQDEKEAMKALKVRVLGTCSSAPHTCAHVPMLPTAQSTERFFCDKSRCSRGKAGCTLGYSGSICEPSSHVHYCLARAACQHMPIWAFRLAHALQEAQAASATLEAQDAAESAVDQQAQAQLDDGARLHAHHNAAVAREAGLQDELAAAQRAADAQQQLLHDVQVWLASRQRQLC
jgi:hypothetical protein